MGVSTIYPDFPKCTLTWREVGPFYQPFSPHEFSLSAEHQNTNYSSSKHTMAIFFAALINLAFARFKAD